MSTVIDAPTETATRIAELTRDGVTLRLSVTDGQPWIAMERTTRDEEGRARTACLALPMDEETRIWLDTGLAELKSGFGLDCWETLEP